MASIRICTWRQLFAKDNTYYKGYKVTSAASEVTCLEVLTSAKNDVIRGIEFHATEQACTLLVDAETVMEPYELGHPVSLHLMSMGEAQAAEGPITGADGAAGWKCFRRRP